MKRLWNRNPLDRHCLPEPGDAGKGTERWELARDMSARRLHRVGGLAAILFGVGRVKGDRL